MGHGRRPQQPFAPSMYCEPDATGFRTSRRRSRAEKVEQTEAIRALLGDTESVLYAVELPDRIIKIGCSTNFAARRTAYRDAVILAFRPGDRMDERDIHMQLAPYRARGIEYYYPHAPVLAVVNEMREYFNLPPVEAA